MEERVVRGCILPPVQYPLLLSASVLCGWGDPQVGSLLTETERYKGTLGKATNQEAGGQGSGATQKSLSCRKFKSILCSGLASRVRFLPDGFGGHFWGVDGHARAILRDLPGQGCRGPAREGCVLWVVK